MLRGGAGQAAGQVRGELGGVAVAARHPQRPHRPAVRRAHPARASGPRLPAAGAEGTPRRTSPEVGEPEDEAEVKTPDALDAGFLLVVGERAATPAGFIFVLGKTNSLFLAPPVKELDETGRCGLGDNFHFVHQPLHCGALCCCLFVFFNAWSF